MRTFSLLLLVALAALAESGHGKHMRRAKRELLLRSKRRWVLSTIELVEEEPVVGRKKLISQMHNDQVKEEAHNTKFRISGKGVDEAPLGLFEINEVTGEVFVKRSIDRETDPTFDLKFQILHRTTDLEVDPPLSIIVEIGDINDNAPIFNNLPLSANVKENTKEGILPVVLDVFDRDQEDTQNSEVTIRMLKQEPAEPKIELEQLNNSRAQLTFKGCFDYNKIKTYKVTVEAKDHGKPTLSSTTVVTLNVVDTNTHLPKFKNNKVQGKVWESVTERDVLRVAVEDKDTPQTPGWRAKYFLVDKKEEEYFQIETDPVTNEGILNVIKGKDYERTSLITLLIGVENEEPLFVCADKSNGIVTLPPIDKVNITIKVMDLNDEPKFEKEKVDVYLKEEEELGKLLFTPKVTDPDSDLDKIRFVLLEDPADWLTINEFTGEVTSVKKMDRESPFVNEKGIYKAVICAIDDGEPPANSTSRLLIHLGDVNDNTPKLASKSIILCGNKGNKAMVPVIDPDDPPYSGPFAFSLGDDDKNVEQQWKLDPAFGMEGGLVSLKPLAYGNYSVPLEIKDQQGMSAKDTVVMIVCDCGETDVCPARGPLSSSIGPAGVGLIILGLLIFSLLLLLFICKCGQRAIKHIPIPDDEGHQTLMKYNEEGGGASSTAMPAMPTLSWLPSNGGTVTDNLKQASGQIYKADPVMIQNVGNYKASGSIMSHSNMSTMETHQRDTLRTLGGQSMNLSRNPSRSNSYRVPMQGGSTRHMQSFSMRSNIYLPDLIERRIHMIDGDHIDHPMHEPLHYAYEGQGSQCQSLDKLSLSNLGDATEFLNDLGPKFKTLGNICHQTAQDNNTQI
ncbi:cadherin-like protein 26 [Hippoglossus hippoglossus]|uniref:cadherin-like protein 26 n=1 Tax=Hippoglossus hippoglossus TaxID=8267 RepID=UPI00148DA50C|nr:cadherin-like protein 26 [Hippoglossus hippoglossus]